MADIIERLTERNLSTLTTEATFALCAEARREIARLRLQMGAQRCEERERIANWLDANGQPGYAHEVRHME